MLSALRTHKSECEFRKTTLVCSSRNAQEAKPNPPWTTEHDSIGTPTLPIPPQRDRGDRK